MPQQRAIECGNRAAMLLVYRTVQAMRAQYNEALVKGQLSGGAVKWSVFIPNCAYCE